MVPLSRTVEPNLSTRTESLTEEQILFLEARMQNKASSESADRFDVANTPSYLLVHTPLKYSKNYNDNNDNNNSVSSCSLNTLIYRSAWYCVTSHQPTHCLKTCGVCRDINVSRRYSTTASRLLQPRNRLNASFRQNHCGLLCKKKKTESSETSYTHVHLFYQIFPKFPYVGGENSLSPVSVSFLPFFYVILLSPVLYRFFQSVLKQLSHRLMAS